MPAAEAEVQTRDPSRYLSRLCQHAGKMRGRLGHQPRRHGGGDAPPEILHTEWSDTDGMLVLSLGRCTLRAADGVLQIRAEASSQDSLAQIQELVTRRLEGFGRRERLTVTWQTGLEAEPDAGPASRTLAGDAGTAPG
jgi:uncharacterized protein